MRTIGKIQTVDKVWLSGEEAEVSFAKYGKTLWYDLRSIDRFLARNRVV